MRLPNGTTEVFCANCAQDLTQVLEKIRQQHPGLDLANVPVVCPNCNAETSMYQFEELPPQVQQLLLHSSRKPRSNPQGLRGFQNKEAPQW